MDVFETPPDRLEFLERLEDVGGPNDWTLLSYCLMTNHVHLLVRLGTQGMAARMNRLLTGYVQWFNASRDRRGHLFGDRYHAQPVLSDEHLFTVFGYIAYNPCRAGLVAAPEKWRWSAHRALAGLSPASGGLDVAAAHRYVNGVEGYRRLTQTRPPTLVEIVASRTPSALKRAVASGFNQTEIAAALGVSQPTIHRLLRRCE